MRRKKFLFVLQVIILVVFVLETSIVFASDGIQKTIKVTYNNLKIYLDSEQIPLKDVNGKAVNPFIYNGTVYIPVEYAGKIMDKSVKWDSKNNAIFFGDTTTVQYMSDIFKPYYSSFLNIDINKEVSMAGTKYNKTYLMRPFDAGDSKVSFNLNGKYLNISGLIGMDDSHNQYALKMDIYGDGNILDTIEIEKGGLPKELSLNVVGVKELTFIDRLLTSYDTPYPALCDLKIK